MTKRILILNGHPAEASLSKYFADTYAIAAKESGFEVRSFHISDLNFDSDFGFAGYRETKTLEPDLVKVFEALVWSDHLVLTLPMWWGGPPAKLKGLFDRILLPGKAFDTRQKRFGFPLPMLSGRTARAILTSDTVDWYFKCVYRRALWVQIKYQVLGFIGVKSARLTHFAEASYTTEKTVKGWREKVARLGASGQ